MSRIKTLLTPFYKLAHPDTLTKAPENIQKANSLALTTLNSYIDSVNQGQNVSLDSLRFYVPRSEQYTECKVTLLPLRQGSSQKAKETHLESMANCISHAISNPEDTSTKQDFFYIPKRARMRKIYEKDFIKQMHGKFARDFKIQARDKALRDTGRGIEKVLNPSHPEDLGLPASKVNPFIRFALEESTSKMLFDSLERNGVRLEKLFFDNLLIDSNIDQGIINLTGRYLNNEERIELRTLLLEIGDMDIGIVLSTRYSAVNVPGFIQIPFDFVLLEFINFFRNNSSTVQERLNDYLHFSSKTDKILKEISENYAPCTLGRYLYKNHPVFENQTFEECFIAAKKLKTTLETNRLSKKVVDSVLVIGVDFNNEKGFLQVPTKFTEAQVVQYLNSIIHN